MTLLEFYQLLLNHNAFDMDDESYPIDDHDEVGWSIVDFEKDGVTHYTVEVLGLSDVRSILRCDFPTNPYEDIRRWNAYGDGEEYTPPFEGCVEDDHNPWLDVWAASLIGETP